MADVLACVVLCLMTACLHFCAHGIYMQASHSRSPCVYNV